MSQTPLDEERFWSDPSRYENCDFFGDPAYDLIGVAARILAAHPNPKRALDVGCGPGRLANRITHTDAKLRVFGFDISGPAVTRAAGEAYHASGDGKPNALFWRGNGRTIPAGITGSFDLAWSVTMFQHVPFDAQLDYIAQVRDRLRPGGVFIFTIAVSDQPPSQFFYPWPDTDDLVEVLTGWFDEVSVEHDVVNDWMWLRCATS